MLIALAAVNAAAAGNPYARFSYSGELARRMNTALALGRQEVFVIDGVRGRELVAARLLGAVQSLIRVFPGCGNRQLQFAYAYGETPGANFVAFSQTAVRAPECPATALISFSTSTTAVTVRSFPEA